MHYKNKGHFQILRQYVYSRDRRLLTVLALVSLLALTMLLSLLSVYTSKAATQVTNVSTGSDSTCAAVGGWVKCWGANQYGQLGNGSTSTSSYSPMEVARSGAMAKKSVDKVAAGRSHACAVADARAYCWGDNSRGQLGNGSVTSSSIPVAVVNSSGSALASKEVIDIAAGANFSCALTSDGVVACWGEGTNGRLGLGNTNDSTTPKVVSFGGKRAVALARPSSAAMCALATDSTANTASSAGYPYCWGRGMDNSKALAATSSTAKTTNTSSTSTRGTNSGVITAPTTCQYSTVTLGRGTGATTFCVTKTIDGCREGYTMPVTTTTYFDALSPKLYSGASQQFFTVDTNYYATAVGSDKNVYYWGGNGQNVTSWSTTKCVYGSQGASGVSGSGGLCGGGGGSAQTGCNTKQSWQPVTTDQSTTSLVGQPRVAGPLYSGMSVIAISGSGFDGLFCASVGTSSIKCDANGTRMSEGQTGSGYTTTCTSSGCQSDPIGLQQVVMNGWLSGRLATQLATGTSGHTCALAANSVACWGMNTSGQLGIGNTENKYVPTPVSL